MTVKLEAQGLYKVYGGKPELALQLASQGIHPGEIFSKTAQMLAVSDVTLRVMQGEIFTIMGLSGSGKSTLVRCLNRLIEPTSGTIRIDGEDLRAKNSRELREVRRNRITMVFQNFALLPHKSVLKNVEFGLKLRGENKAERREKARKALAQVGLSDWGARYPDNLSGGMKQRVGLARALANDADVLLMDEPFSALDPLIRADLQAELLKIQREIQKTIIFITHDFHEAVKLSDHVAMMRDGRFVQIGTPEEIVLNPIDEYVRNFARDLDRARVVTAGTMARYGASPLPMGMTMGAARESMQRTGKDSAMVVDAGQKPVGYLSRTELEDPGNSPGDRIDGHVDTRDVLTVDSSTLLIDVYPKFSTSLPIGVRNSYGEIIGTIDSCDVLLHLSDPKREPADDEQRVHSLQSEISETSEADSGNKVERADLG